MKHLMKLFFLIYIIFELAVSSTLSYEEIVVLLLLVALNIFKLRFFDSIYLTVISLCLVVYGATLNTSFGVLFSMLVYDFVYKKAYLGILPTAALSFYYLYSDDKLPMVILFMGVLGIYAYVAQCAEERENTYLQSLDQERRLRYELENAKNKLLHSSREIASIAEVKERNRIAREIHDSVGHSIAGIFIQLQAAYKLFSRDSDKSMGILKKSIDGLANAVTLLRDTVHNIKPQEAVGIEYIKSIIDNFRFCPVDFKHSGDFNTIPANHLEILSANIKEALTNASKYSKASLVEITIDTNDNFTRLYIKDNGVGCSKMKEGLGLSGIKERVGNLGGSVSINSEQGFLIVCVMPKDINEGGGMFEGSYR